MRELSGDDNAAETTITNELCISQFNYYQRISRTGLFIASRYGKQYGQAVCIALDRFTGRLSGGLPVTQDWLTNAWIG